jgi:hypothetical protein
VRYNISKGWAGVKEIDGKPDDEIIIIIIIVFLMHIVINAFLSLKIVT